MKTNLNQAHPGEIFYWGGEKFIITNLADLEVIINKARLELIIKENRPTAKEVSETEILRFSKN